MLQKLPIGLKDFYIIRTENYLYVDKTSYVHALITGGRYYFLSRPRRFGKSLLVTTLKEALKGHKELFEGLAISKTDYQWKQHAVVFLDFSELKSLTPHGFVKRLIDALVDEAAKYQLQLDISSMELGLIFKHYLSALYKKYGRVAVLIDEYDSPLIHNLHNGEAARTIRALLHDFFSIIKANDAIVDFAFITGVSSFVKAGLFSGINNVQIITLKEKFSSICGYTDEEVDSYYADYIHAWSEKKNISYSIMRKMIKDWYNGYRFAYDHVPSLYNPFSLTHAVHDQQFLNFWFESATPTFLVETIKKQADVCIFTDLKASENLLGTFDIDNIPTTALMFQSGYLTITGYDEKKQIYTLDYPNKEVEESLQKYILSAFTSLDVAKTEKLSFDLDKAFVMQDMPRVVAILKQLFAHVPYQLHIGVESFYHALLQAILTTAGLKAQSELSTSHGRIDLVLDLDTVLYVVEVKFNTDAYKALAQIEERKYYERFSASNKPIILLGLNFTREPHHFDIEYQLKKVL